MPGDGVSEYAAINARVRAMYSNLLTGDGMNEMVESTDFNSLLGLLKHSTYGPYLDQVKDKEITPRRAAYQLRGRLAEEYTSVIHFAPSSVKNLLASLYRNYEVNNLKAILRGITAGSSWDVIRHVLFPFGTDSVLPAQSMVESGNVTQAVELLRGTHYYETLSFAMKRYSTEQNLFPLEVSLDLAYWRDLWHEVKHLNGDNLKQSTRIIGSELDMNNLMWAIRYRTYHNLSEEEVINYTLPFGYKVGDADIRAIAAGADIAQVVKRVYPHLHDADQHLLDPHTGLPLLELDLQRQIAATCRAEFAGSPFNIGIPLAFLVLADYEVQDLVVLIEAKSKRLQADEFKQFLIIR